MKLKCYSLVKLMLINNMTTRSEMLYDSQQMKMNNRMLTIL